MESNERRSEKILELIIKIGHTGVLLIEKGGKTFYYEYGRYDTEEIGMVTIPNIQ